MAAPRDTNALARDVEHTADGLLLKSPAPAAPRAAANPAAKLFLTAHRERTVFTSDETSVFTVLAPRGFAGGNVALRCEAAGNSKAPPLTLGTIALPAVTSGEFDSRQFTLRSRLRDIGVSGF